MKKYYYILVFIALTIMSCVKDPINIEFNNGKSINFTTDYHLNKNHYCENYNKIERKFCPRLQEIPCCLEYSNIASSDNEIEYWEINDVALPNFQTVQKYIKFEPL